MPPLNLLSLLFKFWPQILGAIIISAIAFALHQWRMDAAEAAHKAAQEEALKAQAKTLQAECAKEKQITQEISHDYQNQLTDLAAQLAAAKRVRPPACLPVYVAKPAPGRDAGNGAGYVAGDAINSDALLDFAATGEKYRRQVNACQEFIRRTWAAKGQ